MTSPTDPRGVLLHAFDAHAAAFTQAFPGHARGARRDLDTLTDLADAIVASLAFWGRLCERLDLAREPGRGWGQAGALLLENLFDDVLVPEAWRVLRAAVDLAEDPS
jgi:hypothetical protein